MAADVAIGGAAALGQAPWGLWPLTVLAMAAFLWRVTSAADARAGFRRALAIGVGHFGVALSWIVQPFLVQPEIHGWMAPFALVLMALGGGLFWAVPAWTAHRLGADLRARVPLLALLVVLSDWIRGWIFTGFPWALTGHVWIDTPAGQIAAWGGALILSALTMTLAALPFWRWRPGGGLRGMWRGAALSTVLLAAAWSAGLARLAAPAPAETGLVLRLVQPDVDQTLKWHPRWAGVFYDRLLSLSARPLDPSLGPEGARPDAVIWPETAVPFLLDDAGPLLGDIAAASGAPTLTGIQRSQGLAWHNSLAEVTRDARVGKVYDKFHLVPFGEYIPWGDALAGLGITAFAAQAGNGYTSGPGPRIMQVEGLPPFQPLICYEAIFERDLARGDERPAWLLQITNDAWFGTWSGPYQHLAQARLRAIQTGLPLMRAANTGVSAAIDARGRVLASLPLEVEGVLDAPLPGAAPATLWWRWGDLPMLAALAAALAVLLRRRRGDAVDAGPPLA